MLAISEDGKIFRERVGRTDKIHINNINFYQQD